MKLAHYFFGEYLEKSEKIHAVAHISMFPIWKDLVRIAALGFVIPGVLFLFFPQILIPILIWMGIGVFRLIYELYGWYYDVLLITSTSVLSIKSETLFDVTTNRVEYHMIEGVSYTIKGFWQTIFNFGDIKVEKVGAAGTPLFLKNASNPARIERRILKYQEEYLTHRNFQDHRTLKELLSGMLRQHAKQQDK